VIGAAGAHRGKEVIPMAKKFKSQKRGEPVRFTASITLPDGRVIYAKDYGLKAFPLRG
jgi:hypothetical protein